MFNQFLKSGFACLFMCFATLITQAQQMLVLTDSKTNRTIEIREGDKVLLAFKTTQREVDNQPGDVFILRSKDLQDSAFVHVKTRIRTITDSSIVLKNGREMRISKLAGMRRLSLGKQIARTTGKVVGFLAFATGIALVTDHIVGNPEPVAAFWPSLGIAVAGATLDQSIKDEVPVWHLQRWRVSVRKP
jgi:hypothetical protein